MENMHEVYLFQHVLFYQEKILNNLHQIHYQEVLITTYELLLMVLNPNHQSQVMHHLPMLAIKKVLSNILLLSKHFIQH